MGARATILLVEDNPADVFLVREAVAPVSARVNFHVVTDGEEAMRFLVDAAAAPVLVLLDLNLPRVSGWEVLRQLRQHPQLAGCPVIIISSSESRKERQLAQELGVVDYFRKPSNYAEYMKLGELVQRALPPPAEGSVS